MKQTDEIPFYYFALFYKENSVKKGSFPLKVMDFQLFVDCASFLLSLTSISDQKQSRM